VGDRSRGRFATPADFPRDDGTPYRKLHVRRWGLGFVHHSRAILCRPVPYLTVAIRNFFIAVCWVARGTGFDLRRLGGLYRIGKQLNKRHLRTIRPQSRIKKLRLPEAGGVSARASAGLPRHDPAVLWNALLPPHGLLCPSASLPLFCLLGSHLEHAGRDELLRLPALRRAEALLRAAQRGVVEVLLGQLDPREALEALVGRRAATSGCGVGAKHLLGAGSGAGADGHEVRAGVLSWGSRQRM
jgi:hypothetical protein